MCCARGGSRRRSARAWTAASTTRSPQALRWVVGAGRRRSRARPCGWRRPAPPSSQGRRSTSTAAPLADTLFVTGRLAEPALRNVVSGLDIGHAIAVMDNMVTRGRCEGDGEPREEATGLPVRKGPADVRSLPEWYGRAAVQAALGPREGRVLAELNDGETLWGQQARDR